MAKYYGSRSKEFSDYHQQKWFVDNNRRDGLMQFFEIVILMCGFKLTVSHRERDSLKQSLCTKPIWSSSNHDCCLSHNNNYGNCANYSLYFSCSANHQIIYGWILCWRATARNCRKWHEMMILGRMHLFLCDGKHQTACSFFPFEPSFIFLGLLKSMGTV